MVVPKVDHDCVLQGIVADLANRSHGPIEAVVRPSWAAVPPRRGLLAFVPRSRHGNQPIGRCIPAKRSATVALGTSADHHEWRSVAAAFSSGEEASRTGGVTGASRCEGGIGGVPGPNVPMVTSATATVAAAMMSVCAAPGAAGAGKNIGVLTDIYAMRARPTMPAGVNRHGLLCVGGRRRVCARRMEGENR